MKNILICAVEQLEGGDYGVNDIVTMINKATSYSIIIGLAICGLAIVVGFILYALPFIDNKQRVKSVIGQTIAGTIGIMLGISFINIIINIVQSI